ncbi:hypothetical protein [Ornithinimicrobium tianjinense]|uniref:Helix-hairpin-helix domain-containing protein n=1 Tax=Ornithinimicrobium tianjinense TaxID=1195761 RepID=A0A917BD47_9MICO|nr:hypothetical protein [Ornithinimicrobium tianjinense]GGF38265.1 hypothetical protein GCM10011366_02280 [Ornithinimicrobium tianjinense]
MMIRPAELAAIKKGEIDLAFRRWDRPRVKVGTRMRTAVGVVEVTDVQQVTLSSLRAEDARRAGASSLSALKEGLSAKADRPVFRVQLRYAGADPREALREKVPDEAEIGEILAWLDRLDAASKHGPWTRATLAIIDRSPEVRAPELAAELGRETLEWKADVRKLKEKGLTESLAIGYRLSPRGEAVLDHGGPRRERAPRPTGTPLPRTIGAPATRALRAQGVTTLEQVGQWSLEDLRALHGVGPVAIQRLEEALAERGHGIPHRTR